MQVSIYLMIAAYPQEWSNGNSTGLCGAPGNLLVDPVWPEQALIHDAAGRGIRARTLSLVGREEEGQ